MKIVLGERDYEKTDKGLYPKYNLHQLNIFISMDCPQYSGMCVIKNMLSFDLFGKYSNELNEKQKTELDEKMKNKYGIHNVDIDYFIDIEKYIYNKEKNMFFSKQEG